MLLFLVVWSPTTCPFPNTILIIMPGISWHCLLDFASGRPMSMNQPQIPAAQLQPPHNVPAGATARGGGGGRRRAGCGSLGQGCGAEMKPVQGRPALKSGLWNSTGCNLWISTFNPWSSTTAKMLGTVYFCPQCVSPTWREKLDKCSRKGCL